LGVDCLLKHYNHWNWHFSITQINYWQFSTLNHSLLLSIYYFFPICCTIPNDLKFFKHLDNLPSRMNPKSNHNSDHFFIQIWPCEVQLLVFSQSPIQMLIYCNLQGGNFWKFFHIFSNQHIIRSYRYMCWKMFFFLYFWSCTRSGNFGAFLVKHSQIHLGVKDIPHPHLVWKLQRKRIKNPFVVSCPKFLHCQKTQFGPLGFKNSLQCKIE